MSLWYILMNLSHLILKYSGEEDKANIIISEIGKNLNLNDSLKEEGRMCTFFSSLLYDLKKSEKLFCIITLSLYSNSISESMYLDYQNTERRAD